MSLSEDGSNALFDLVGGVRSNVESTTALISVREFTAGHSIYNITEENNKLEFGIQTVSETSASFQTYPSANGVVNTSGLTTANARSFYYNPFQTKVITIPAGRYDTADLCQQISYQMWSACISNGQYISSINIPNPIPMNWKLSNPILLSTSNLLPGGTPAVLVGNVDSQNRLTSITIQSIGQGYQG